MSTSYIYHDLVKLTPILQAICTDFRGPLLRHPESEEKAMLKPAQPHPRLCTELAGSYFLVSRQSCLADRERHPSQLLTPHPGVPGPLLGQGSTPWVQEEADKGVFPSWDPRQCWLELCWVLGATSPGWKVGPSTAGTSQG